MIPGLPFCQKFSYPDTDFPESEQEERSVPITVLFLSESESNGYHRLVGLALLRVMPEVYERNGLIHLFVSASDDVSVNALRGFVTSFPTRQVIFV